MKKLYFLDESEKERILKLHESHTKKQYLMTEQATYYDALSQGTLGSTLRGAGAGTQIGMFAGIPGMIIGGAVGGLIGALYSSNDRPTFNGTIRKLCTANKVGPAINSDKLDDIAKNLNGLINTTNYLGGGYASDDSAKKIGEQLGSIASIPDLCGVIKNYKEIYNKDLMSVLSDEFYKTESWINSVKIPLRKAIKKTEELSKNADASKSGANVPENWKSYPCVTKSTNVVATRLKNGSLGYKGGGFLWYSNGRKQNLQNGEMSNYHCGEDGKVKEGLKSEVSNKQFANVEPVSGIGVVIPSAQTEIPTLMKMAGMEGQPINQDTINKLYDILLKK